MDKEKARYSEETRVRIYNDITGAYMEIAPDPDIGEYVSIATYDPKGTQTGEVMFEPAELGLLVSRIKWYLSYIHSIES